MNQNNLLLDRLPCEIDGLKINTDFRVSILFDLLITDPDLSKEIKIAQSLVLFYSDQDIVNIKQAIDNLLWFYNCGKVQTRPKSGSNNVKKLYSFEYDSTYIFSAFFTQYKIDLNTIDYLHWWKFKAMFDALNEDNLIMKIMGYRGINLSKIKDKEQQSYYRKMKRLYQLPDPRTDEEKMRDFTESLGR